MLALDKTQAPFTATTYVVDAIREGILAGRYPFGSRLDQKKVADELGFSIPPIREAIRLLEAEGFVKTSPRRGVFVTNVSIEGLQEIYLVREVLEELAAQLAVPKLSNQILEKLGDTISQMEEATTKQDYALLLRLNREFHFTIYQASGQELLVDMIVGLWNRSSLYRRLYTYLPERAPQSLAEHKQIYTACQAGDAQTAGQATRHNVQQTVKGIVAKLSEVGL